jgi:hypothetical protein
VDHTDLTRSKLPASNGDVKMLTPDRSHGDDERWRQGLK